MDKTAERKTKKKNTLSRTYEEICAELGDIDAKDTNTIDRYMTLLQELSSVKELSSEQVQFFLASAKQVMEDAWCPFLVKATIRIKPYRTSNTILITNEIIKCCHDILMSYGLSADDMEQACLSFRESKDAACITDYLERVGKVTSKQTAESTVTENHKITLQELACVTFVCFNFSFRKYSPSSFEPLIIIDRAIAEYFSNGEINEYAGKTLGSVLGSRVFSAKRITELVYMYHDTTEKAQQQAKVIDALRKDISMLKEKNGILINEIEKWKEDHAGLVAKNASLEAEKARYRQDRVDAESMLEYERNKYERQMQAKEAGLAEQLARSIELEIQAIRETVEYVDEDNQRRIRRRLQRIEDILKEFGGKENA